MNIHALVRVSEQWRSQERGWLVAARILCARVRVRASVCPSLTDMFFSKQLHPRSVRSSRKKCSSAAFSSPGKSRNNPTVSSQNMKSNIMKKWVCISFLLPVKTFFFCTFILTTHIQFYRCFILHSACLHYCCEWRILQVPLSPNCNN